MTALHFANLAPKLEYSSNLSLNPSRPSVTVSPDIIANSLAPISTLIPGSEPASLIISTSFLPSLFDCLIVSSKRITPEI